MDANAHYSEQFPGTYEQSTLPVLSRPPPKVPWPATDQTPIADPYTISCPEALAPQIPRVATPAPKPVPKPAPTPAAQASNTDKNASSKVRKPRKPANAAAGKSTLFWVHTDLESAAGGTKEETLKRIRSHVMSEHNRKKRLENTKRYKSKSFKHLALQSPETMPGALGPPYPPRVASSISSTPSSSSYSRRSSHATEQLDECQELVPVNMAANGSYYPVGAAEAWDDQWDDSWDDSNFDEVVDYQSRQSELAPTIWTYLGSGARDPFNTGHTQLTDRMMRHLQNCQCLLQHFRDAC